MWSVEHLEEAPAAFMKYDQAIRKDVMLLFAVIFYLFIYYKSE